MSVSHNRYEKNKASAFTLIEILVTIAILATITIVAYASYSGYTKRSFNSERIAAIDYLKTSLDTSYELKKTLPEPNSNYISYDERGSYLHSSTGAYGLSGHASRDFLSAGYLNFSVLDPETKQFYGYGKLTDNSAFDLATVLSDDGGGYKTYLRGTYKDDKLVSLIRSYSSSDFVSMDSTDALPYNPYERKITAQISSYSGVVIVNDTPNLSLTGELNTGDTIKVATGATARLHISDGSELFLGSTTNETILELKNLTYSDDNNLASKVSLFLTSGEVWVEAPHLRTVSASESEYTIETDSAVATVRGTVFSVSRDASGTHIGLVGGKLEVQKKSSSGPISFNDTNGFSTNTAGNFVLEPSKSFMVVREDEKPIALKDIKFGNPTTSTGTIDDVTILKKIDRPDYSPGYIPRVSKVSMGENMVGNMVGSVLPQLSLTAENPGATSYELLVIAEGSVTTLTGALEPLSAVVAIERTLPTAPTATSRTLELRLCGPSECSAPFSMSVPKMGDSMQKSDAKEITTIQTCPNGQEWFGLSKCQKNNLVAIAPYNHRPSFSGSVGMFTKDGGNLLAGQDTLGEDNTAKYIPQVIGSVFKTPAWSCTILTCNLWLKDLKEKLGMTFFLDHTIFEVAPPGKLPVQGLYMNSHSNDAFINYDLSKLHLGDDFSIEMSVRGAALKRGGSAFYHLFNLSTDHGKLTLDYSQIYWLTVNMDSDPGKIFTTISFSSLGDLSNNAFYKIFVRYDRSTGTAELKVMWENIALIWVPTTYTKILQSTNSLFIWSKYNKEKQWNDIIDYVKIYKN